MGCGSSAEKDTGNNNAAKSPQSTDSSDKATTPTSQKIHSKYKLGEVIGEGGYSKVKIGTNITTKENVAIKIVTRKRKDAPDTAEEEKALRDEVNILRELSHPNITRCMDFYEEPKYFYVVLEYLDGGELFDRIVKKTCYNEKESRDLVFVLLQAIKYLHDQGIAHRDLKPENLLLKTKTNDHEVTLADFGFAIRTKGDDITDQCGTPGYIAPEILKCVDKDNKIRPYGKACDMWAFGVILFILLGGYPPFHNENQREMYKSIMKGDYEFHEEYWQGVSNEAKELIQGLLTVDPSKRLTVQQALEHKWLGKSAEELAATSLDSNLAQLKKYVKTRKMKKAARAIMAVNRMNRLLQGAREAAAELEGGESEETRPGQPT